MKVILPLAVVIAVLLFFGVGGVNSLVRQDEEDRKSTRLNSSHS